MPIQIKYNFKKYYCSETGITFDINKAIITSKEDINYIIEQVSEKSLYAHNERLKNGYLITKEGIRIGIAGECVFDGQVKTIKNITSNCLIRATFYNEIHFYKYIVLSGTFIQQIIIKDNMKLNQDDNITSLYSVTGKLLSKDKQSLNDKLVTIIDSKGNKYHSITDCNGVYRFNSLIEDRYTLLFPFLSDYNYLSPSLYVINLKDDKYININALVSSK
jgi:stage III sporulation protein SpoIIIAA